MNLEPSHELIFRIGQLAIQFAYLEDQLLELLVAAEPLMTLPTGRASWDDYYNASGFASRAQFLRSQLTNACDRSQAQGTAQIHRDTIKRTLDKCEAAARRRNEILHSPSIEDSVLGSIVQARGRRRAQPAAAITAQEVGAFVIDLSVYRNQVRSLESEVAWLINATRSTKLEVP